MAVVPTDAVSGGTNTSPLVLTWPLGAPPDNEVLLAWVTGAGSSGAVVPPSGWIALLNATNPGNNPGTDYCRAALFWKPALSELSTSTWTATTTGLPLEVALLRVSGGVLTTPQWAQTYNTAAPAISPALAAAAINSLVISAYIGQTTITAFSTPTNCAIRTALNWQAYTIGVFSDSILTSNTTTSHSYTTTITGSYGIVNSFVVIIAPSNSGGSTSAPTQIGSASTPMSASSNIVAFSGLTAAANNVQLITILSGVTSGEAHQATALPAGCVLVNEKFNTTSSIGGWLGTYLVTTSLVTNPTFTLAASHSWVGLAAEFSNASGVIDVQSINAQAAVAAGTLFKSLAVTPTAANDLFLALFGTRSNANTVTTPPAGFSELLAAGGIKGSSYYSLRAYSLQNPTLSSYQPGLAWGDAATKTLFAAYVVLKGAAGVTLHTISFAASANQSTTLNNTIQRPLAALIASVASLTKNDVKSPFGAALAAASSFGKTPLKVYVAAIGVAGTIGRALARPIAGTLAEIASLVKASTRATNATLLTSATTLKTSRRALSAVLATISFSVRQITRNLTGSLSNSAVLSKKLIHTFMASIASSGLLATFYIRQGVTYTKSLVANINVLAVFNKQLRILKPASLTPSAASSRSFWRTLLATVAPVSMYNKALTRQLTAVLSITETASKKLTRTLISTASLLGSTATFYMRAGVTYTSTFIAGIPLSGSSYKRVLTIRAAALTITALINQRFSRILTAGLNNSSSFSKYAARSFAATLPSIATTIKLSTRQISAALVPIASFVANYIHGGSVHFQAFFANITPSGTQTKQSQKSLGASLIPITLLTRSEYKKFSALLNAVGNNNTRYARSLAAMLINTSSQSKIAAKKFTASATLQTNFVRQINFIASASLGITGTVARSFAYLLLASLSVTSALSKEFQRALSAVLATVSTFIKLYITFLAPPVYNFYTPIATNLTITSQIAPNATLSTPIITTSSLSTLITQAISFSTSVSQASSFSTPISTTLTLNTPTGVAL